jgi:hypothetical protein
MALHEVAPSVSHGVLRDTPGTESSEQPARTVNAPRRLKRNRLFMVYSLFKQKFACKSEKNTPLFIIAFFCMECMFAGLLFEEAVNHVLG